jgi:hypothetical protein
LIGEFRSYNLAVGGWTMLSILFLLGLFLEGDVRTPGMALAATRHFIGRKCSNLSMSEPRRAALTMALLAVAGCIVLATDWFVSTLLLTEENILRAMEFTGPPLLGLVFGAGAWALGLASARVLRDLIECKYPHLGKISELRSAAFTVLLQLPAGCIVLAIAWLFATALFSKSTALIAMDVGGASFGLFLVGCSCAVFRSISTDAKGAKKPTTVHG